MKVLCQHLTEPIIIDGEMMSANFQDLMKQFNRKTNVDTSDAVYYVFDIITLAEFKAGKGRLVQTKRREILEKFIDENQDDLPHVAAVAYELVDLDTPEGQKRFKELNAIALERMPNGKTRYEGLMLKNPDGLYTCKRTDDWLKVKPVYTVTLPIVDLYEGKPDTKYVGMMGGAHCAGHDGDDPRYIDVNCGGGWSDDQRERFWKLWLKNPATFKGVLVDIDSDGPTQDQHGNWSLRFPRFKTFRGLTPGQKI
jgi:DNA ligase-1